MYYYPMKNKTVVLEISHKYIKIVIGKMKDDEVNVVYCKKVPIHHLLENGTVRDKVTLINELTKLNPLLDDEYHINQMLDDVVLILPPYGLEVYRTNQITTVISPEKIIGKLDIKNIYSIIRNKKLPNENELVNIILDDFSIDSGERFGYAPINQHSGAIRANAKVVTLPKRIDDEYTTILKKAGIKVCQKVVSSYGAVEILRKNDTLPNSFFLIDIGANSTCISLVGNKELVATRSFSWGGDTITEKIIEKYNINEKDAENAKVLFGLDKRETDFRYPVIVSRSEDNTVTYYREDLNETIKNELESFTNFLKTSIEQLKTGYQVNETLPIYLIGGGSKLIGLVDYLKLNLFNDNVFTLTPKVMGARDPSLFSALGAILVYEKYLSDLDSEVAVNVMREE